MDLPMEKPNSEEEQNGSHCDGVSTNGMDSPTAPLQNGLVDAKEPRQDMKIKQVQKQATEEPQQDDVSCVLSNVLDEVENNVDTSDNHVAVVSEEEGEEAAADSKANLENGFSEKEESAEVVEDCKEESEKTASAFVKEEVSEVIADVVQKVLVAVENGQTADMTDGPVAREEIKEQKVDVLKTPIAAEEPSVKALPKVVTDEPKEQLSKPNVQIDDLPKKVLEEPAQISTAPVEPAAIAKAKKSKAKQAKVAPSPPSKPAAKPLPPSPSEELDSVVKCVSSMCDVLESVDHVVTTVYEKEKKTISPKSKSKTDLPKPVQEAAAKPQKKNTANEEKMDKANLNNKETSKADKKEKGDSFVHKKEVVPKKKEKTAKLPPKVPSPPEKAKRKPRKKRQQPLVAPVLPFPTYFPPPPMMAPQHSLPHSFNFPAPVPVDLSVGKKKVCTV